MAASRSPLLTAPIFVACCEGAIFCSSANHAALPKGVVEHGSQPALLSQALDLRRERDAQQVSLYAAYRAISICGDLKAFVLSSSS